ncbi:unnamed protein product (macronuclear) [Paramecium tetraurelia]|uniref:Transmembrane protein n=1 Tax=Paramecium tetraurelia TaxID=5888 RepID=A0DLP4_PARTE|nr:uncharacterized protein GSPATT00039593001 [Paramecium tetraurelia]CAK83961.1 unnamed protein product [Paramecium tetraurelia]|eukprot:XP_001451358.1 hypothetical protein (macronuclear) [Paramecium tetraurelia strain d4-2]
MIEYNYLRFLSLPNFFGFQQLKQNSIVISNRDLLLQAKESTDVAIIFENSLSYFIIIIILISQCSCHLLIINYENLSKMKNRISSNTLKNCFLVIHHNQFSDFNWITCTKQNNLLSTYRLNKLLIFIRQHLLQTSLNILIFLFCYLKLYFLVSIVVLLFQFFYKLIGLLLFFNNQKLFELLKLFYFILQFLDSHHFCICFGCSLKLIIEQNINQWLTRLFLNLLLIFLPILFFIL